jgi:cyclomaltodextrinase
MVREPVCHKSGGAYAYLLDPHRLSISLKAKKDYLKSCRLFYGDPWEPAQPPKELRMNRVAADDLFDYFRVIMQVPASKRLIYAFLLDDGSEQFWYTEAGFHTKQPEPKEMGLPFFQMLYIREGDTVLTPDWAKRAIFYQIFPERFRNGDKSSDPPNVVEWGTLPVTSETFYGGDLKGIIDSLPYLNSLGVNSIYLTPIFSSPSSHKYDTTDYYMIDPHFGNMETLCGLVRKCHEMGLKIVLDGVFDHCGFEFWAFQDVVQKGSLSKYKNWFKVYDFPIEIHPVPTYETWGKNVWRMPRFMTSNPEVKKYLIDVAVYWIKEADIDGWRLDTASEIDHEFWREFRREVKAAKPEALIMGEISQNASAWLEGDQLDSVMNYPLRDIIADFFAKGSIKVEEFDARLAKLRMQYYQQVNDVLYNLLGSHDTVRFLSLCDGHVERMKLAIIFQMTYVGMPAIYYGDEIGLKGSKEWEDNRPGMIWDETRQDLGLLEFCRKLINVRKDHRALTDGDFATLHLDPKTNTYAYLRKHKEDRVLVALNNSSRKQSITIESKRINPDREPVFTDLLTARDYRVKAGNIHLSLEPCKAVVLSDQRDNSELAEGEIDYRGRRARSARTHPY